MNNIDEIIYLEALSQGDHEAFELLFLHYQPKLVYFLKGFVKNDELARDMAQDIFLSIWKDRSKFSEVKSFQAYIFKMAKNAVYNYYDHINVNKRYVTEQQNKPIYTENTEEIIFANQLQCMIDVEVSQMPPRRKQIYLMSRVEGFSNGEIAEKLRINKRTVENHLTSALADLKKIVKMIVLFFLL